MNANTILVAERFNASAMPWADRVVVEDVERWLEASRRLGAFRRGHGREKLESLLGSLDGVVSMNLLPPSPTRGAWDARLASRVAEALWRRDYDRWILVGRRVAYAFGNVIGDQDWLEEHEHDGRSVVVVPHPSGLNRWWNHRHAAIQKETPRRESSHRSVVGRI